MKSVWTIKSKSARSKCSMFSGNTTKTTGSNKKRQYKDIPDPFTTRTTKSNIAPKQAAIDRSLHKVTKKTLESFDAPLRASQTAADNTSILASSVIKKRINTAAYESVRAEQKNNFASNLTYAQNKA